VTRSIRLVPIVVLALLVAACAPLPQRTTLPSRWQDSPNHDERRPNFVILHHTSGSSAQRSLATLTDPARAVSAHYLVGRDGTIWQLVDERQRAWHAGESYWGGDTDLNSSSIGIELDNDGDEPFAEPQIVALIALLRDVTARNRIPPVNVLGHGDVAPGRKVDPSRHFPWRRLAEQGFGSWCDGAQAASYVVPDQGTPAHASNPGATLAADQPPSDASAPIDDTGILLLQALGYDVSRPQAAIAAFRRHYRGEGSDGLDASTATEAIGRDATRLDANDVGLLRCLLEQRRVARVGG
jgi:N-acetylmuramoyl-L-alanine amidase